MTTPLIRPPRYYSHSKKICQSLSHLKSPAFSVTTLLIQPDFLGPLLTKLMEFHCLLPWNPDVTEHCNTHLQPFVSCTIKFICFNRYILVCVLQSSMKVLLLNSFSMCNVPSTYSFRIDCANGFKNVGKWGFPFPNQSPAKRRLPRLNLNDKK